MFNIDKKQLKQYQKNLEEVAKNAFPKTVRSTLDRLAFLTVAEYKKNVKKSFVVRSVKSNIIIKSIRYEKCKGTLDTSQMEALTGQGNTTFGKKTDQLRKQEYGETLVSKSKHIVKPTKYSRGGSYRKLVKSENFMANIKVKKITDLVEHPAKNEFQQFRQAIGYIKHNPDKKIHFLPSGESYLGINGIAELSANGDKSAKFIYSLKDKTQALKPTPVLKPAANTIGAQSGSVFEHEMQRRIIRELSKGLNNN